MCHIVHSWIHVAPSLTPFVALIAVGVAWRQLALNRANQRETTAKAIFREYLRLAVENSDLAEGDYQALVKKEKSREYEWFVGYFLWAAEEILDYAPKDAIWQFNLQLNAKNHREYFMNNKKFREVEINGYKPNVRALIERVIQQA
jgi:hypothetical protein